MPFLRVLAAVAVSIAAREVEQIVSSKQADKASPAAASPHTRAKK